jgi:Protein of unknown function (DUF1275)
MLLGAGVFFLMTTFFTEVRQTLVPRGEVKHGPLPPLLVAMTLVTGLVDAFSYLVLGHVFVANMTGNVVFLAFALAGASGFSILASLVALCSFVLGSLGGGLLGSRLGEHRGSPGCAVGQSGATRGKLWTHHCAMHRDGAPERHRSEARGARPDDDRPHLDHRRHLCRQSSGGRKRIESRPPLDCGGGHVGGCPPRESTDFSRVHRLSARDRPHRHGAYRSNDASAFAHGPGLGFQDSVGE